LLKKGLGLEIKGIKINTMANTAVLGVRPRKKQKQQCGERFTGHSIAFLASKRAL